MSSIFRETYLFKLVVKSKYHSITDLFRMEKASGKGQFGCVLKGIQIIEEVAERKKGLSNIARDSVEQNEVQKENNKGKGTKEKEEKTVRTEKKEEEGSCDDASEDDGKKEKEEATSSDDDSDDDEAFLAKFDDNGNLISSNKCWSQETVLLPPTPGHAVVEDAQM